MKKHIDDKNCTCKQCKYTNVEKNFQEANCTLIDPVSLSKKMQYICSCGEISSIRWYNFKIGERCKECAKLKMIKNSKKRKTIEDVSQYFLDNNCVLLETEYINQSTKMQYICSCGNQSLITWKQFKKGCRCLNCANEKIKNRFIPSGPDHFRWNPNREEVVMHKKIRGKMKKMLKRTLFNKMKDDTTYALLGYTRNELISHLSKDANWESVKNLDWEIDHYFPIKAFYDYSIYDIKLINCLENIRPLIKEENRSKNAFYNKEEFENWLKMKNQIF